MLREADANGRINVRIHPVSKARMIAECDRLTRQTGDRWSLSRYLNSHGWGLAPINPAVEAELRMRSSGGLPEE